MGRKSNRIKARRKRHAMVGPPSPPPPAPKPLDPILARTLRGVGAARAAARRMLGDE